MNLKEVQKLITSVADLRTLEFKLNSEDFKIVIRRNKEYKKMKMVPTVIDKSNIASQIDGVPRNLINTQSIERMGVNLNLEDCSKYNTIKSSFIGTFLLGSLHDKSRDIGIGDVIKKGDILCLIGALGLLNEIRSDVSGKITAILLEDFSPVEYGQPLFIIAL